MDLPDGDRDEGLKFLLFGDLDLDLVCLSFLITCLGGEALNTCLGGEDLEALRGGDCLPTF